jgi:hypothetical protein
MASAAHRLRITVGLLQHVLGEGAHLQTTVCDPVIFRVVPDVMSDKGKHFNALVTISLPTLCHGCT